MGTRDQSQLERQQSQDQEGGLSLSSCYIVSFSADYQVNGYVKWERDITKPCLTPVMGFHAFVAFARGCLLGCNQSLLKVYVGLSLPLFTLLNDVT